MSQLPIALENTWSIVGLIGAGVGLRLVVPAAANLSGAERARRTAASIIEFIDSGLIALLLVFCIIRPFVVQAFYIPSESMEDTLLVNDRILVNKFIYRFRPPQPGDIIVFKAPEWADQDSKEHFKKDFIKRCMAVPGQTIQVNGGKIYRDGKLLDETYIKQELLPDDWPPEGKPFKVPPGCLVVFGDHRDNSNDSRKWHEGSQPRPCLPRENVLGKAMVIFWPPSRIRILH